jgi:hypothetical protein
VIKSIQTQDLGDVVEVIVEVYRDPAYAGAYVVRGKDRGAVMSEIARLVQVITARGARPDRATNLD